METMLKNKNNFRVLRKKTVFTKKRPFCAQYSNFIMRWKASSERFAFSVLTQ